MTINRYNYQEIFLLYTDNELRPGERREVEAFIDSNPDLASELEMLQQVVLKPDREVVFYEKELLLHTDAVYNVIHPDNFDDFAISYLDNELTEENRAILREFLFLNPGYQKEFKLLQSLRFDADVEILFNNKELLYHKESADKSVVYLWLRVAIAAMFILFAGTLWYNRQTRPNINPDMVRNILPGETNPSKKMERVDVTETGKKVNKSVLVQPAYNGNNNPPPQIHNKQGFAKKQVSSPVNKQSKLLPDLAKGNLLKVEAENLGKSNTEVSEKEPPLQAALANSSSDEPGNRPGSIETIGALIKKSYNTVPEINRVNLNANPSNDYVIVTTVANMAPDENSRFGNSDKKGPLRGILRKASRFIDKNTASLTSKKSGLLIGNLEIAFQ